MGMTEMISRMVEARAIPDAGKGFTLHFSDEPFQVSDAELIWLRSDAAQVVAGQDGSATQLFGNWYCGIIADEKMEGWLCPALRLYFRAAPTRLYVKVEPLPAGVDPVWHVNL